MITRESDIERRFKTWCNDHDLECIKISGVRGFPDRLILGDKEFIMFVELKKPGSSPRKNQHRWIQILRGLGFRADWYDNLNDAISGIKSAFEAHKIIKL